jgi:sec-independent protein translocase protein TatC
VTMSSVFNDRDASDDLFQDTRMSFGDHIEVLRQHLFRAIIWFSIAMCLSIYPLSWYVLDFISKPVEKELMYFYNERVRLAMEKLKNGDPTITEANKPRDVMLSFPAARLRELLGLPAPAEAAKEGEEKPVDLQVQIKPVEFFDAISGAERLVGRPPTLATLNIAEAFLVYFKVAIYCGIVLGSPWIFWEIWMFIAAGLYPHEKKYVYVYLPFSLGLFLLGVVFCEVWVIPYAVRYLLNFNRWIGVEPDLRLNEWLSFAIMAPLVFGTAFQTPLVMLFLHKLGIVDVTVYRKHRRMAYFILALIAAFLAAAPDAFNMMMLAIPLWGLYELGILLCHYQPRQEFDADELDAEERVEV